MRRTAPLTACGAVCIAVLAAAPGCALLSKTPANEAPYVEVVDTLPELQEALTAPAEDEGERTREAWQTWERKHAEVLAAAGATPEDPGDVLLRKLSANPETLEILLRSFTDTAHADVRGTAVDLEKKLGPLPPVQLVLGVARPWQPVFRGTRDRRAVVLLNARHPALATSAGRRVAVARALFSVLHESRVPDSKSLGPLAQRVLREGAASLAVRMLVSDVTEEEALDVSGEQLPTLRKREALLARELLAAIDSAAPVELHRFFSADVKDPLLPRGAGRYIADRLFQRLAQETGSLERPLRLSPAEFLQRTRPVLHQMARGG